MEDIATTSSTSVTPVTATASPVTSSTPILTTVNGIAAAAIPEVVAPPPTSLRKPTQSARTIRIHINTIGQPHPVILNYRQLYKREAKRLEEQTQVFTAANGDVHATPLNEAESADDAFYRRILANAEKYDVRDDADDVEDDDGSDEEDAMVGSKKGAANDDYDYDDDFIDDSEMLMEEPAEYNAPEFDGFFIYHGPLDGSEESEKKSSTKETAAKRKAASKPKTSTSNTTTTSTVNKKASTSGSSALTSSKKDEHHNTDDTKKSISATTSKPKKQTTLTSTLKVTPATISSQTKPKSSTSSTASLITTVNKKTVSMSLDQPAKKKKKVDNITNTATKPATAAAAAAAATNESSAIENRNKSSSSNNSSGDFVSTEKKKKSFSSGSSSSSHHELKPLDPEIEEVMEKLKRDVIHEDFENKAKFPNALKPTVLEAGLIMLRKTRNIDDNLVYHLMTILPYNRFTLRKFVTTKAGEIRVNELQQEIDELAIRLKQTIDKMMPEQQQLFNERLAVAQAELNIKKADPNYKPPVDEDGNPVNELPTPKFKCNDEVRKILYDIIQSEEQSIHISNQMAMLKDPEKKNDGLASDNKARKLMYQRLLSCWPEEWMNTYEMSRQYSQYKLKMQGADKKAAAASGIISSQEPPIATAKKRKRIPTPQSSPSDETRTKKQSIAESGVVAPDLSTFIQKIKEVHQPSVITIDDDDEEPTVLANTSWKQSNSMKIEALISGPNSNNSQKKPSS